MRLIDADALLERMMKTSRYFMVKFDIEEAPTIEPVHRGRWVQRMYDEPATCSECGGNALALSLVDEFGDEVLSRYCPHCGARMENAE